MQKNSGRKRAGSGWLNTQVGDQCKFHWSPTWESISQNHQPTRLAITCNHMAGDRPALFPMLFFAPSLFYPIALRRDPKKEKLTHFNLWILTDSFLDLTDNINFIEMPSKWTKFYPFSDSSNPSMLCEVMVSFFMPRPLFLVRYDIFCKQHTKFG